MNRWYVAAVSGSAALTAAALATGPALTTLGYAYAAAISTAFASAATGIVRAGVEVKRHGVRQAASNIWSGFKNGLSAIGSGIATAYNSVKNGLVTGAKTVYGFGAKTLSAMGGLFRSKPTAPAGVTPSVSPARVQPQRQAKKPVDYRNGNNGAKSPARAESPVRAEVSAPRREEIPVPAHRVVPAREKAPARAPRGMIHHEAPRDFIIRGARERKQPDRLGFSNPQPEAQNGRRHRHR